MAKIEIDDKIIDNLVGNRVTQFNKVERDLCAKISRRDTKIKKLEREIELLKGNMMGSDKETADRIAKIARCLVGAMQRANWVDRYYECSEFSCADDDD